MLVFATSQFDLPIAIRVPFSEILAFSSVPFLLRGINARFIDARLKITICVLVLWFVGAILSDIVNANHLERAIRGCSKPIFVLLWMLFFIGLLNKDYRLLLFMVWGKVLASIQNYLLPQDFTADHIAAGGYEATAFVLVPLVMSSLTAIAVWFYMKFRLLSAIVYVCMAVMLVLVNAPRSSVAVALMVSVILSYMWWIHSGRPGLRLSIRRLAVLAIVGSLAMYGIYECYVLFATKGWLGEYQQAKLVAQSATVFGNSPIGLIMAGRPQVFGALVALMDYPIFGSGSWTAWQMTDYFYDAIVKVGGNADVLQRITHGASAGVGHSILLQIWLENGFLALIALLSTFWIMTKVFLRTIERDSWLTPIILSSFISFTWAFLFSPFGTESRQVIGMFFAFYIVGFPQIWQQYPSVKQGGHLRQRPQIGRAF